MTAVWQWLSEAGAQRDVVEWARPFGDDFEGLWARCPRGDWLLAIAARLGCDRRSLVRAACACARLALDYLPEHERRPAEGLAQVEAWCRGESDAARLQAQRAALDAAVGEAPDAITGAAAASALSALDATVDADAAASTVAFACQAAVLEAADCGMEEALRYTQGTSAERVREILDAPSVAALFRQLP